MAESKEFFKQARETAEIKAEVLPKLFTVWSAAVVPFQATDANPTLLFLDLNAGQGFHEEGGVAAVFEVLKAIFINPGNRSVVHPFLYEQHKGIAHLLLEQAESLSYVQEMQPGPVFLQTPENKLAFQEALSEFHSTLIYADPFSPKYALEVWSGALERERTDYLMLFESKRMMAALRNPKENSPLSLLLGERVQRIQEYSKQNSSTAKKESFMIGCFEESLHEKGYRVSRFRINQPGKEQTSHYLLFVSKTETMHARFKELMLEYTSEQEDGVPLFGANLKTIRLLVPEYSKYLRYSMVKLYEELAEGASQYSSMSLEKIYEKHGVGKPYSKENYKQVFEKLKEEGKVMYLNPKTGQMIHKLTYISRIKYKS